MLAADWKKSVAAPQIGGYGCSNDRIGCMKRRRRMTKKPEEWHQKLVDRRISSAEGEAGYIAQNHETDSLEWRFTSDGTIGARCKTDEEM